MKNVKRGGASTSDSISPKAQRKVRRDRPIRHAIAGAIFTVSDAFTPKLEPNANRLAPADIAAHFPSGETRRHALSQLNDPAIVAGLDTLDALRALGPAFKGASLVTPGSSLALAGLRVGTVVREVMGTDLEAALAARTGESAPVHLQSFGRDGSVRALEIVRKDGKLSTSSDQPIGALVLSRSPWAAAGVPAGLIVDRGLRLRSRVRGEEIETAGDLAGLLSATEQIELQSSQSGVALRLARQGASWKVAEKLDLFARAEALTRALREDLGFLGAPIIPEGDGFVLGALPPQSAAVDFGLLAGDRLKLTEGGLEIFRGTERLSAIEPRTESIVDLVGRIHGLPIPVGRLILGLSTEAGELVARAIGPDGKPLVFEGDLASTLARVNGGGEVTLDVIGREGPRQVVIARGRGAWQTRRTTAASLRLGREVSKVHPSLETIARTMGPGTFIVFAQRLSDFEPVKPLGLATAPQPPPPEFVNALLGALAQYRAAIEALKPEVELVVTRAQSGELTAEQARDQVEAAWRQHWKISTPIDEGYLSDLEMQRQAGQAAVLFYKALSQLAEKISRLQVDDVTAAEMHQEIVNAYIDPYAGLDIDALKERLKRAVTSAPSELPPAHEPLDLQALEAQLATLGPAYKRLEATLDLMTSKVPTLGEGELLDRAMSFLPKVDEWSKPKQAPDQELVALELEAEAIARFSEHFAEVADRGSAAQNPGLVAGAIHSDLSMLLELSRKLARGGATPEDVTERLSKQIDDTAISVEEGVRLEPINVAEAKLFVEWLTALPDGTRFRVGADIMSHGTVFAWVDGQPEAYNHDAPSPRFTEPLMKR